MYAKVSGNWDPEETDDPDTAISRHGYIIMYAGCPIKHKCQLKKKCAVTSTYINYTWVSYELYNSDKLIEEKWVPNRDGNIQSLFQSL